MTCSSATTKSTGRMSGTARYQNRCQALAPSSSAASSTSAGTWSSPA